MGGNRLTLIRELTGIALLDDRFKNLEVVNCDPVTGEQKQDGGMLSVVLRAEDVTTGLPVAIKFFDPDFVGISARHRLELFQRESELLERLRGKEHCLELVQPLRQFDLRIVDPASNLSLTLATYYFVVEWLDADLIDYFLRQHEFGAAEKLQVFRAIVLAVFSLHREGIYHRDLKRDNLRVADRRGVSRVVAIDLGTAAAFDSPSVGSHTTYAEPVGAGAFSPIEAFCGLAGVRRIGVYSDIYALGCMLHDLFNVDYYYIRLFKDAGFQACWAACKTRMMQVMQQRPEESVLLGEWSQILGMAKHQVTPPCIDGLGHSVPAALRDVLNRLLQMLTSLDYRQRLNNQDRILRQIDAGLRILTFETTEQKRREQRRQLRRQKEEKLIRLQKRLEVYLDNKTHPAHNEHQTIQDKQC